MFNAEICDILKNIYFANYITEVGIYAGISFSSEDVWLRFTMVNFPLPMETASRSGLAAVEARVWPRNGVGLTMVAAISLSVN